MRQELDTVHVIARQTVPLTVTVLYTTAEDTVCALKRAAELAHNLGSSIRLLVMRVVPFPLPLNAPPVPVQFMERQAGMLAREAGVDTDVHIIDCRDREEVLMGLLPSNSVVVLGDTPHWLPGKISRLARLLRRQGHEVVLIVRNRE